MLRRSTILAAVTATYVGAMINSAAEPQAPDDVDDAAWRERLVAAEAGSRWVVGARFGTSLSALPGDRAFDILRECWPEIAVSVRKQILKGFTPAFKKTPDVNPRFFDVMHLGMTDPDAGVREFATIYLQQILLLDLEGGDGVYDAWYEKTRGRPAEAVTISRCRAFVAEGRRLDANDVPAAMKRLGEASNQLREFTAMRTALVEAGLFDVIDQWIDAGLVREGDRGYERLLFSVRRPAAPGDDREPLQRDLDELLPAWEHIAAGNGSPSFNRLVHAVAGHEDPRAIPVLIGIIDADNSYDTVYGVGYFGLTPITGVDYDETHDGAWWRAWWGEHRHRFPAAVAALEIPDLREPFTGWKDANAVREAERAAAALAAEFKDLPSVELAAPAHARMRYFLIGPRASDAPPADGYRVLVILPGGDGSAEFHPFCMRIVKHALPPGYVGVQLVAPAWTDDPERRVWPTRQRRIEAAGFATEDFINDVVKDVRDRLAVDDRFVFTLGWSSGGPPLYSASLQPDTVVTGTFIAMSVFHPEELPALSAARDRAYYILHSPDDWISFERFPKAAERSLREHGANVELATYRGGHGWTEDPFGNIRRGVEWLAGRNEATPPLPLGGAGGG